LKVAFPPGSVDGANVIFVHYLGEVPVLLPGAVVERDEVHASLSAEVPSIEPVPILKFVPWFSPG